ncbi:MAG: phosphodiester glycosidase family protein [Verrucomicrobiales bacterium]|nr:phosphodiester glycosidase family protein [Verrucomicrobiales bacterium]
MRIAVIERSSLKRLLARVLPARCRRRREEASAVGDRAPPPPHVGAYGRHGLVTWGIALGLVGPGLQAASVTVGPWSPLFQGVEFASGQQLGQGTAAPDQQVRCLRVDLTEPGIELFGTPKCADCVLDTLSENTSRFLEQYGLQVAVNGAFYGRSGGASDTTVGTPDNVLGLAISQGVRVSAPDSRYAAALFFTERNEAFFLANNNPPTNTAGIHTAVSGNRALLVNGAVVQAANPSDLDPRTALGLSADRRYLFLLTIDGRQPGWSDGADFRDTGEWLKRFGAADGINVDGGGSTTMVMADCLGAPERLNRPSYVAAYGRERIIGHNFGVRAPPLDTGIRQFTVEPGTTTALLTWETAAPATTQVEFGLTPSYGNATPLDSRPLQRHVATLADLQPATTYFYRATSSADGATAELACRFTTTSDLVATLLFDLTQEWTFTTNNLDGVNWTAPEYNDADWLGRGPGLLAVEDSPTVGPRNTVLPPAFGTRIPRTYYFRTHFTLAGHPAGVSLTFSNYVDDAAVFYLNGVEVYRLRMPPHPEVILNSTLADGFACAGSPRSGDANIECPDVFTLGPEALTSLVEGDNVLAVEVHNYTDGSLDIVFGTALILHTSALQPPRLNVWREGDVTTLFWNGTGFTLEQTAQLGEDAGWSEVRGPITRSPVVVPNTQTTFYRLRR